MKDVTIDVDHLDQLYRLSTDGPWTMQDEYRGTAIRGKDGTITICRNVVAASQSVDDARLIVAMRDALPALLRAYRSLESIGDKQMGWPDWAREIANKATETEP